MPDGAPPPPRQPEPEQDLVVAGRLRRLWAQPHAGYAFRPLAQMCQAWADEFDTEYAAVNAVGRIDPGLARAGIALFRELPATADSQVLLCTDLHGDNILAARREPWLVIDPKPYVGDPAYDVLQHMLNCEDRLAAGPAALAARMAGLAGVHAARGVAVAVRQGRAGVARLAAHAPGGQAACADVARRRLALSTTTPPLGRCSGGTDDERCTRSASPDPDPAATRRGPAPAGMTDLTRNPASVTALGRFD